MYPLAKVSSSFVITLVMADNRDCEAAFAWASELVLRLLEGLEDSYQQEAYRPHSLPSNSSNRILDSPHLHFCPYA